MPPAPAKVLHVKTSHHNIRNPFRLDSGLWISATSGRTEQRGALSFCGHLCSGLQKLSSPSSCRCELRWGDKPNSRRWWPGQFQPVYTVEKAPFSIRTYLLGQNPPPHNGGQQEMGLFIQVPLSTGATLRRDWTQITGLRTTAWGGVRGGERGSSCTPLRSRDWEKKPQQTWVRRACTLICQVFTSAVHSQ